MKKMTWRNLIEVHNIEGNPRRTVWRVVGYGLVKKGRVGYTPDQLKFILSKNFNGYTDEQWGIAVAQLFDAGYLCCKTIGRKKMICLTESGEQLFRSKYSV